MIPYDRGHDAGYDAAELRRGLNDAQTEEDGPTWFAVPEGEALTEEEAEDYEQGFLDGFAQHFQLHDDSK